MKKVFLQKINSTNSWLKANWKNLEDKTVVFTFNQTDGVGQFNRKWINLGENNLFFSILLIPENNLNSISNLTLYTCCVLCDLLSSFNLMPSIKLPNDVLINNKKIAGILAQSIVQGNTLKMICLGVGININAEKQLLNKVNQPVSAINLEQNKIFHPNEVLDGFLKLFFEDYNKFMNQGFDFIEKKYLFYQNN